MLIDLRSDTVTKPNDKMREAMFTAIVGDDVYEEDPTITALETRVAQMFGKESALFFPSGTQSNLTAALIWCNCRGSEMIVGDNSHMFLWEQAGASQFGGISMRTVPNTSDGTMDLDNIRNSIRDDDFHEPITKLICIENTHNACGGKVLSIEFLTNLKALADSYNLPIHLDGARVWNSITKMNIQPSEIAKYVDSLSVCLSKGLGAPVGSLLVGSSEFIKKSKRLRKALGGGMRQSGILAAAGLVALDDFEAGVLASDHKRASDVANAIEGMKAFKLHTNVETNIIFIDLISFDDNWDKNTISSKIKIMLKEKGILVSAWAPLKLRLVIHRDISDNDIISIIKSFNEVSEYLLSISN